MLTMGQVNISYLFLSNKHPSKRFYIHKIGLPLDLFDRQLATRMHRLPAPHDCVGRPNGRSTNTSSFF